MYNGGCVVILNFESWRFNGDKSLYYSSRWIWLVYLSGVYYFSKECIGICYFVDLKCNNRELSIDL